MNFRIAFAAALGMVAALGAEETADHRLRHAAESLHEIMAAPDKGIPHDILERSSCVAVLPGVKKAAFLVAVLEE